MSTTVTYKGNTITTVNNNTKTLTTAGKYLEANVILTDITGQGDSSGYTRTVVVPEQIVTPVYHSDGNTNGYSAQLNNVTEMFEQWSEYIVTFNSTEYYFTTLLLWGSNFLMGEQAYLWSGTSGTNYPYPFCVISTSINNSYIYTASADSVSVKVEKLELNGSGGSSVTWENIYSNEVNVNWEDWSDNPNNNCYYVMIPWTESIDYGSVWRITWDGTPYECTATLAGSSSGTPYMLGNNTYNNLEGGNNEPFMLQRYDSNLVIVSPDYGTHTILIEKQVTSSNATLITKTITANGTYSASDDDADGYSSVTVNVPSDRNTYITSWTQGTISYVNGTDGGSTTRCKTDEYISASTMSSGDFVGLTVATGYKIGIREYASEDASSFVTTYMFKDGSGYGTGITIAPITQGHYYKFIVGKSDNSKLAPEDVPSNVLGFFDIPVETTEKTITVNGTYNALDDLADGYSEVTVNVPSSAASSWTKVAETSYQVRATNTTASTVATWETGHSEIWTSDKIVYVRVRDTAGKRAGYFYGSDQFFMNEIPANGGTATDTTAGLRYSVRYEANNQFTPYASQGTTGYGIFADRFYSDGRVRIRQRYHSTYSLTVNGTYKVEVYLLDPPTGTTFFT